MDERADRAIVIGSPGYTMVVATRWLVRAAAVRSETGRRMPGDRNEMYVRERERELKRERKQRQARTPSRTRPEPAHFTRRALHTADTSAVRTGQ
jgi:hypothetical protein